MVKQSKFKLNPLYIEVFALLLVVAIFAYLRLNPIILGTVPYTYDQGRDFLKAEEVVKYQNLTFIGPTTGIMGLNHGAWWYYALSIPYIVFRGWPYGFYVFMFALVLITAISFYLFLRKSQNNYATALLFLGIVTVGSYFIPSSFQVSNNYMVPPTLVLLIYSVYQYFATQKNKYIFLTALALGFIFEFEVAFGFFIIPAAFATAVFFKEFRSILYSIKKITIAVAGLVIPLIPRILFEIKNNFLQTTTLINFFFRPSTTQPQPFYITFNDRIKIFKDFYTSIFVEQNIIPWITLIVLIAILLIYFRKLQDTQRKSLLFLSLLSLFLFLLSLAYRNNFFWSNYYEGMPYIFLMMIILIVSSITNKLSKIIIISITCIYVFSSFIFLQVKAKNEKPDESINFTRTYQAVKYVINNNDTTKDYCVRIYTPPVVPYTYNYLFAYESRTRNIPLPSSKYKNKECWYIMEGDVYSFRLDEWKKTNIPAQAKRLEQVKIGSQITIEQWQEL